MYKFFYTVFLFAIILSACEEESTDTGILPEVETIEATLITHYTAYVGGKILNDEETDISAVGICWSNVNQLPETTDDKINCTNGTNFSDYVKCLQPGTTYYVRAFATNKSGTAYGNVISLTTVAEQNNTSDIEGNIYETVTIGSQVWMKQNLRTTRFNSGEQIATTNQDLTDAQGASYQWAANNDINLLSNYGRLYTWYAVTDSRNLCPCGWHVPDNDEWSELIEYLGGEEVAGGKLKESGTSHWLSPNVSADNSSGFTALPAGIRDYNANFVWYETSATFWSSSDNGDEDSFYYTLDHGMSEIVSDVYSKNAGFSVRCVKDGF